MEKPIYQKLAILADHLNEKLFGRHCVSGCGLSYSIRLVPAVSEIKIYWIYMEVFIVFRNKLQFGRQS